MTRLALIKNPNRFNQYKKEIVKLDFIEEYGFPPAGCPPIKSYSHTYMDSQPCTLAIDNRIPGNEDNLRYYIEYYDKDTYNGVNTFNGIIDLDSCWSFIPAKDTTILDFKNIEGQFSKLVHNHNIELTLQNL